MNYCVFAAVLIKVVNLHLALAKSLVVIDVGALRKQMDNTQMHRSRRADASADAEDPATRAFRPADYLRTALNILSSYSDDDLEDTVSSFTEELKQLKYDNNVYETIVNNLSELQKKPGSVIKEHILDVMQMLDNDIFKALSLKLGSVNEVQAVAELMNTLRILDTYRYRSTKRSYDLVDAIISSLRSAVNYILGPEQTTPAPAPPLRIQSEHEFKVSPRTMRAMVEAISFAYKWINILSEQKKDEKIKEVLKNTKFPKKEMEMLRHNLPDLF